MRQSSVISPTHPIHVNSAVEARDRNLKIAIWLYFLLVIFEGALRKWILPGLATPLLIVRDPVGLAIVGMGFSQGKLALNRWVLGFFLIAGLGTLFALTLGHGNLFVAAFGARIFFLHLPAIFVIGQVLSLQDVHRYGRFLLWISLPMTLLIGLQFYSPQSAWVNQGVGGVGSAGFEGAMGRFRPPGTFSFTNGTSLFFGLMGPFVFYAWLKKGFIPLWLKYAATVCLLFALPLSISRGLVFQTALSCLFAGVAIAGQPKLMGRFAGMVLAVPVLVVILATVPAFEGAIETIAYRFEAADRGEGGTLEGTLGDRFLGGLIRAVFGAGEQPFFGYGIGMGTNVGAMLVSGERAFLIAEGEWGRLVGELGTLLGLLVIALRINLALTMAIRAWHWLRRGHSMPWLLLGFSFLNLVQGGWAQPSALGFSVLAGGLTLASMKRPQRVSRPARRRDHAPTLRRIEAIIP